MIFYILYYYSSRKIDQVIKAFTYTIFIFKWQIRDIVEN